MTLPSRRSTWLLAATLTLAGGAHAASFDCKAAKSTTEKAICGSPTLSALDEQLARDYERALHALSPAGGLRLKESQRSWLRYATQVCTPRKGVKRDEPMAECLAPEFKDRLAQLAQVGLRLGPYVFNRIDFYASGRVRDDQGGRPGYVTDHVAYPQIDTPVTPATTAWNAAQRKDAASGELQGSDDPDATGNEDDDTDYTLACANERFISLQVDQQEYTHGTPHGQYSHDTQNAVLAPAMRKMGANDFFAAGSTWKARLPPLFVAAWLRNGADPEAPPSVKEAIEAAAADPGRWLVTPEGLRIAFSEGEVGCHACDPGPITVGWAALKRLQPAADLAACKAPPAAKP